MIKGIIFDLDGVLVDAVQIHFQSLNKALALFGFTISEFDHEKIYNGLPTMTKLDALTQRQGLPVSLHPFIAEMKQVYQILERAKPRAQDIKTGVFLVATLRRTLQLSFNSVYQKGDL